MADVNISKYRASVVRDGSKPASPGFVVSEGQDPVNPPGTNNFVPYTGATANVELGEFGVEAGFVTLDTTPTNIPTDQGAIYWDDTRSTAALIMNGTLQHIGQDSFFYVKNSSGSTIPKGTCVGFAGTDGGSGHLLITPFLANGSVPSTYFMGVTSEEIANGSFGQVMHFGELEGINTSGFTAGALLYASSTVAGGFQTTAPVAPNNIILVAAAVNSKNNGAIVVRPTLGSNFGTNESVKLTSVANLDLLQYQSGTGVWENKTIDGAGIVTKATTQSITGTKTFGNNNLILSSFFNANATYLTNSGGASSYQSGFNFFGFNTDNHIYFAKSSNTGGNTGILAWSNTATRTYTLKDASGTLAFTSDIPTNPVGGTGTTNYLPKFTGSTTIGNSLFTDNGTIAGVGNALTGNARFNILNIASNPALSIRSTNNLYEVLTMTFDESTDLFSITNKQAYSLSGIAFGTNNTERVRITQQGNLLVGTTSDNGARLQVSGAATFSSSVTANGLNALGSTLNNGNAIRLYRAGLVEMAYIGWTNENTNNSTWYFKSSNGNPIGFSADGINQQVTIETNGNVGIGTSSPNANLEIATANSLGSFAKFRLNAPYYNYWEFVNNSALEINRGGSTHLTISNVGNLSIGSATDPGYKLFVNGNTYIRSGGNTSGSYGLVLQDSSANNLFLVRNDGISTFTGNVGIGTSSPAERLHVETSSEYQITWARTGAGKRWAIGTDTAGFYFNNRTDSILPLYITNGGNVLIGTTTDNGFKLRVEGNNYLNGSIYSPYTYSNTSGGAANLGIAASGEFYRSTSSLKYKKNVQDYNKGLSEVLQMRPVTYNDKNDNLNATLYAGLIAEEIDNLGLTEFVQYAKDGSPDALSYSNMVAILVKAIQELKQEIDTLKN